MITVVIVDAARYQACTEASTEKLLQGQVPVDNILVLIIVTKDIVIKVSDVGAGKIAQCIIKHLFSKGEYLSSNPQHCTKRQALLHVPVALALGRKRQGKPKSFLAARIVTHQTTSSVSSWQ